MRSMELYVIVLRLLHVIGGIFWAGAGLYSSWFLQPAARELGQSGAAFMRHLMGETRLGAAMGLSAVAAVVSGVLLYWHDFGAIVPFNASMGGFALGGAAAIAAWVISVTVMLPSGQRMQQLGARAAQGEDVGAEMTSVTTRMGRFGQIAMWLMVVAVVCMAVARYL
jgi:uncharacterized membrane protein